MINELDIAAPAEVQNLDADVISTTQINLSWDANTETDLDYYRVFRDGVNIANTTDTYYYDTGLTPSTWYDYEVTAVDTSGNEGIPSDSISIRTPDIIPELPIYANILLVLSLLSVAIVFIFSRKK
jgi:fibronectin type 3 domain-containing protein